MILLIFIGLAFIFFYFSIQLTKENKKNRLIAGVIMMLSVLTYPLTLPLLHETRVIQDINGTGSLIVFHLLIFFGGIITIIAGIFTKKKPIESNE